MAEHELFDNRLTGKLVAESVRRLFDDDGTIYLATGYLTWSGWLTIRGPLVDFLDRSPDNRVIFVVSTGADQFSRMVAEAIWGLDDADRVQLLTYRDGFIHPKLYLRDGERPAFVMGSANLTWDGLGKNLELAWYYAPDGRGDPIFVSHLQWMIAFVGASDPVTPEDLTWRVRLGKTRETWMNKGRINLPLMVRGALPFGRRRLPEVPPSLGELLEEGQ